MQRVYVAAVALLACGPSSKEQPEQKPQRAPVVDVTCPSGTEMKRQPWRQQQWSADAVYTEGEQAWCERPDGKRHGPLRINYMSGKRAVEGAYRDGVRVGTWVVWHSEGPKGGDEIWVDGRREGAWRSFRTDGKPWGEGTFKNDKLEGAWVEYAEDGRKAVTGQFVDGKPSGDFARTNPDGTTTMFAPDPARYDPKPIGE